MPVNELLLAAAVVVIFGSVLLWYRLFGDTGLMAFTVFATITANIEVLILVDAYGMEMTLGNILFASTFLVTDILSEVSGKKAAERAVRLGILTSALFIVVSQSWLLYRPAPSDWVSPAMREVFSNTPRMMIASLAVYAIAQVFDVWLYHKWWALTERLSGDRRRFLWLRNNGSTLISQLLNAILFTLFAFYGTYDGKTLVSVVLSSYVIFIVTSLLDTPVVYLARRIAEKRADGQNTV
ncbi:queuosine precursor transporter [Butyricicoccus faecihominis]|uniref:queuosine precursor transporter n=1 Tax=Butyricicoccaceae TaxID=3085642 RepID=UPI00247AF9AF|nr:MULTISPECIES: queuosine precursor transporter [Butyricicoccaceae]MCQ5129094.1 queuosine precursor transporter [Butyricicoccus faecihominis]WNX84759.1 queuosine precursor transporter [Agathobaculum sp. NTUH-O15-33]